MPHIPGNGGSVLVDMEYEWVIFESFSENVRRIVRDAGVNIVSHQVESRINDLRSIGKTDAEIEAWLEEALKWATHNIYAQAGHPQSN